MKVENRFLFFLRNIFLFSLVRMGATQAQPDIFQDEKMGNEYRADHFECLF